MFDNHYLTINPSDYVYDVYNDGEKCELLIAANEYDFYVFGQPIF